MANVVNCKKCGTLFLQTSGKPICDKCVEALNKLVSDINNYVLTSTDETVPMDTIFEKFPITRNEFEEFFVAGRFVRIAKKVTMVCTKCGQVTPIEGKTGSVCRACIKKIQSEI